MRLHERGVALIKVMMQTITVNLLQYCKEYKPRLESGFDKPVYFSVIAMIKLKKTVYSTFIWNIYFRMNIFGTLHPRGQDYTDGMS